MGNVVTSEQYMAVNGKKFDILKLVLAVLIVAIHSSVAGMWFRPVLRLAVPLFFMISSYLFFSKQRSLSTLAERKRGLLKYAKRILTLYLFWFVLLLPFTIYYRQWYESFSLATILEIARGFLFGSTFIASWFLMASLTGVVIVWLLARWQVSNKWIVGIGVVVYAACCLFSNYYSTIAASSWVVDAYNSYISIFASPFNSFPCSLLFVAIGKVLAEGALSFSRQRLLLLLAVSMVALYVEFIVACHYCVVVYDDCYFSLPVACTCIFVLIGQSRPCELSIDARKLRACSTIIYCSHATVVSCLGSLLRHQGIDQPSNGWLLCIFFTALALSTGLSLLFLNLEKRKPFHWLRYSH